MLLNEIITGFIVFIFIYVFSDGEAKVHHSSMSGKSCGDKQRSWCQSLNVTKQQLTGGDTIVFYPEKQGIMFAEELKFVVKGNLTITGATKGVQIIGRTSNRGQTSFSFRINGTLTLKNVNFVNMMLYLTSSLHIENSEIINSTIKMYPTEEMNMVNITNVVMTGHALCPKPTRCQSTSMLRFMEDLHKTLISKQDATTKNIVNKKFKTAKLLIQDSEFYETLSTFTLFSQDSSIKILRCKFSGNPKTDIVSGYVRIYSKFVSKISVAITDSLFYRLGSTGVIDKVNNLAAAALRVKMMAPQGENTKVLVTNTTFIENERGLSITGPVSDIIVNNCKFINNSVLHAGAGVLLLTEVTTKFNIDHCVFDGNKAGDLLSLSHDSMKDKRIQLTYDNDLVSIKSGCCKGQVQPLGKGGAIRVQNGSGVIKNSHFRNNTANILGANLLVEGNANVTLQNISINTVCDRKYVRIGEVFYSTGAMVLDDVRVSVCEATPHNSLIRHIGGPKSLRLTSLKFVCPSQHSLHFSSAPGLGAGLGEDMGNGSEVSSKLLEEMVIHCKPCQGNTYSIDQGIFEYISANGSSSPRANSSVKLSSIQCLKCPYGAKCSDVIKASDNFWGYPEEEGLVFVKCPEGQCCTGNECQGFNSCPGNRHGPLCSMCVNGTSRNPFNGDCLPDEKCSSFGYVCRVFIVLIGWNALVLLASVLRGNIQGKGYTLANTQNIEMEETNADGKLEPMIDVKTTKSQQEEPEKPWSYIYILLLIFYIQDTRLFWSSLERDQLHSDMITRNIKPIIFLISDFSPPFSASTCLHGTLSGIHSLLLQLATLAGILLPVTLVTALVQGLPWADKSAWITTLGHCSWFVSLAITQKLVITVFSMLYCVKIVGHTVLYMDSTVECFQPWQISLIIYMMVWFLSASIVITMAGGSLINHSPSVPGCLVCWWCPLLWVLANIKRFLKRPSRRRTKKIKEKLNPSHCLLRQFGFARKEINWLGVILVYRVTLAFAFVTVQESLLRIISMAAAAFVFLLLQTHLRPKATLSIVFMLNLSTVLSVTVLGMALVKASLAMGIKSRSESQMAGMGLWTSWTINILGVWLPFLAFAGSLIALIIHAIWRACNPRRR